MVADGCRHVGVLHAAIATPGLRGRIRKVIFRKVFSIASVIYYFWVQRLFVRLYKRRFNHLECGIGIDIFMFVCTVLKIFDSHSTVTRYS